ncbi:type I-E CRISPR-associated protein Cas5/CasD [Streptomyces sedi]|uniref:Type I-E CRISPR-associated protein Cas5/CasD n=1 Tax=Streptomyces sedi TaxID=555059 RepID=A0A5C4UV41_9ACTN|nr:type I-E CRISPR-associated protein Cas5/CasD [Streptomyces sedi]TNM27066.1 type I-E CRISPR-associated protein Cas5/CasD [Streptomyces sedi]
MPGYLIHLSAPLQSAGTDADFEHRPTQLHPTRGLLTGLHASALGRPRTHLNPDLAHLTYTIRIDRPGQRLMDFHTIGGGRPRHQTVAKADGTRRAEGAGTILTERWYLADAAFTIAVTGPTPLINQLTHALDHPVYAPYLGRRSCPPDAPLRVTDITDDPVAELDHLPLHTEHPPPTVTFIHETAPTPDAAPTATLRDDPDPTQHRAFNNRDIWHTHRTIPAPTGGIGTDWIETLIAYRNRKATP